jgi:hypothetical protein
MTVIKRIHLISLIGAMLLCSCTHEEKIHPSVKASENGSTLLREINGDELLTRNCITCHSKKYIDMQPSFTRKTWEKIVSKMIKNFGAPVSDSSAKLIVDYLVQTKGVSDSHSARVTSIK